MEFKEPALKWRKLRTALHSSDTAMLTPFEFHRLGQGAFCEGVFRVEHRKHGIIAVKVVGQKNTESLLREVGLLQELDHENILRCLAKAQVKEHYAYAMLEYMDGCSDLFTFIMDRSPTIPRQKLKRTVSDFSLVGRRHILLCVLQALVYLDSKGIVHNDVKPENVLVGASTMSRVNEETVVKLIDFGLACRVEEIGRGDLGYGGSTAWLAPEKLSEDGVGVGPAGDVYTFGLLVWATMTGNFPYVVPTDLGAPELYKFFEVKLKQIQAKIVDEEMGLLARRKVKQLLLQTLKFEPRHRKTAKQLLECEFFEA